MRFWRIELLKDELRKAPLSQRGAFAYVLGTGLLYTVASALPGDVTNSDWAGNGASILLMAGGTYAAYRANGGSAGSDFAARYFALGWVLFIRLSALVLIPTFLVVFAVMAALGCHGEGAPSEAAIDWSAAVIGIGCEALYYWRLVHHFAGIAPRPS